MSPPRPSARLREVLIGRAQTIANSSRVCWIQTRQPGAHQVGEPGVTSSLAALGDYGLPEIFERSEGHSIDSQGAAGARHTLDVFVMKAHGDGPSQARLLKGACASRITA